VEKDVVYYYKLKQVDFNNHFSFSDIVMARINSAGFTVFAQPNPYQENTFINVHLGQTSQLSVTILSTIGQVVAELVNGILDAGTHQFEFTGRQDGLGKGVYTARVTVDGTTTFIRLLELD
jgi:hypothetical protein